MKPEMKAKVLLRGYTRAHKWLLGKTYLVGNADCYAYGYLQGYLEGSIGRPCRASALELTKRNPRGRKP